MPERAGEPAATEGCTLVGRVVVIGKKGQFVQLKVSQRGQKTLKVSLKDADKRMKVGQMWRVKGKRQGNILKVVEAELLESEPLADHDKTSKSARIAIGQTGDVGVDRGDFSQQRSLFERQSHDRRASKTDR